MSRWQQKQKRCSYGKGEDFSHEKAKVTHLMCLSEEYQKLAKTFTMSGTTKELDKTRK